MKNSLVPCAQLEKHDQQLASLEKALELYQKKRLDPSVAEVHIKIAQVPRDPFPERSRDAETHFGVGIHLCYDHDPSGRTRALLVLAKYFSAQRQHKKLSQRSARR